MTIEYAFKRLTAPTIVTPGRDRRDAPFRSGYDDTLDLLFREVGAITGGGRVDVVIEVDVDERDLRRDGLPKARARWGDNPGVWVSFTSRHGPMRIGTDKFTGWQGNLRAVALALEALRKVDRYGVASTGEQYRGYLAIEPARKMPGDFPGAEAAIEWMRGYARDQGWLGVTAEPRVLYRNMAVKMHPDTGWPRADWDKLNAAGILIKESERA